MAISMSGATVTTDQRDELNAKSVDGGGVTSGGATANTTGFFNKTATGASLAGITASFAQNVSNEIENYISEVDMAIERLSAVQNNVAFRGSGIETALNNFVDGCKSVAKSYTNKLKEAENEIISSVAAAYQTQDADISGNVNSDRATVESEGF